MSKSSTSTYSVKVRLCISWKIKIYNDIYTQNIDTSSKDIGTNEASGLTIFKVVIDPATILLSHFRVDVEARVTELGDLFGQKLNSLCIFAENDCLVNVKFWEESV